ncbi:MAG: hypothetical protein JO144_14365 [Actinobacteria bacterium]|nr:hypothetical protein [Actinomycetota bacterium]
MSELDGSSGRDPGVSGAHFQLYRIPAGSAVGWRLLGGNHRPIGRGAVSYPALPECLAAVKEIVDRLAELESVVTRAPLNRWEWRLRFAGGADLVVGAHPYDRRIRAVSAHLHFRSQAATARIDDAVLVAEARRGNRRIREPRMPPR